MPSPAFQDVHVNRPLTDLSVAYLQNPNDYIADKVFPVVPSDKPSNIYFVYDRGAWYRDLAQERTDGTPSAGGGYTLTQKTFSCTVYGLHKDIGPQVREATDSPLDADRDATLWLTQQLAITRERQFMSNYFTTGKWTGTTTGADIVTANLGNGNWDVAGSKPIEDIETQQFHLKQTTGLWPNVLVIGPNVYLALKNHAEFTSRFQYVQQAIITPELIARVISPPNVPETGQPNFRVLVTTAIYNSAAEGAADNLTWAGSKTGALLAYAAPNPGIQTPSAGYIFTWTPIAGYTARIYQVAMPENGLSANGTPAVRVEGEMSFSMNQVAGDMAGYFSGVVS